MTQIMGRAELADGSATLAFPGTELFVQFKGDTIGLKGEVLGSGSYFNVYVDGKAKPFIWLEKGAFEVPLVKWLNAEEVHTLRLVRRNEAWQGIVRLDEWVLPEGGELVVPSKDGRVHKIMCIGDSITCGQNVDFYEGASAGNHNANAEGTYGYLLAKHFDAQMHLVSCRHRAIGEKRDSFWNSSSWGFP